MQRIIEYLQNNQFLRQSLVFVLAFVVDFFTPLMPIILACYTCILVDMYYGIKVACKQGAAIRSRYGWTGTIKKFRDTSIALVLCNVIERFIIGLDSPFALLTVVLAVVITLTELLSIVENLNTLDPDGPWKIFGAFLAKKGANKLGIDEDLLIKQSSKSTEHENT